VAVVVVVRVGVRRELGLEARVSTFKEEEGKATGGTSRRRTTNRKVVRGRRRRRWTRTTKKAAWPPLTATSVGGAFCLNLQCTADQPTRCLPTAG